MYEITQDIENGRRFRQALKLIANSPGSKILEMSYSLQISLPIFGFDESFRNITRTEGRAFKIICRSVSSDGSPISAENESENR